MGVPPMSEEARVIGADGITCPWEFVGLWLKVRSSHEVSAAMQAAPPDKLPNPPRSGGNARENSGLAARSAA
jgi:hypothetical protein